jgi:hypothetical protein
MLTPKAPEATTAITAAPIRIFDLIDVCPGIDRSATYDAGCASSEAISKGVKQGNSWKRTRSRKSVTTFGTIDRTNLGQIFFKGVMQSPQRKTYRSAEREFVPPELMASRWGNESGETDRVVYFATA